METKPPLRFPGPSRWLLLLLIPALLLVGISNGAAAPAPPEPKLQKAPLRQGALEPLPPGTGFRPPPMDLSHLTGQKLPRSAETMQPPSAFDWRTSGKVTTVKNQGACGSCYTFAAIGNFESRLLIDGAGTYNFSENNAKECNWRELNNFQYPSAGDYWGSCDGGNYYMLASLFSQKGTVLESCDAYQASDVACKSTCAYQKTLLDWRIISEGSVPSTAVLKQYIYDHGPVYTSMYAGYYDAWDTEFSGYDGSYTLYHPGTESPNHAVLIVGWDDSLTHAGGTGGWIVKNSWGTSWGASGYFTIAYGSASIGTTSSFVYDWQDYDPSGDVWYYDDDGWWDGWGYSSTTAWGLAKYIPPSNTYVTRVEFWTTDATTDIDVYVYDGFNGTTLSNLLASKLNLSFDEAGYHSVALDSPLAVTSGDDVIAVVKFTNASYTYPIATDPHGTIESGRTYMSSSGSSWTDMGAAEGTDVAIRLRTTTAVDPAPTVTSITPNTATNTGTVHVTNLAGTDFQTGATVKLTQSGQPDVPATGVSVVSTTTITCDLDLLGVATGQWNVVVTNPDAQSGTLPNGFAVTTSPTAPTVTSITPSSAACTGTVSITDLAGTNFQAGATARLTKSGQPDVPATGVTVASSTTITCDLDLTGVATGQWNVVVTNPDAQGGVLSNGFTVLPSSDTWFIYLPLVSKRWPPIPYTPVLNAISDADGDGSYTVSWSTADLADTYTLQEDDNAAFSSPVTRYSGSGTSWNASKSNGTYYYRVKATNTWGDSSWSNVRSVQVTLMTDLYVQNDLGTTLHLTINGVGTRNVSTGLYHWGKFPAGTYSWSATASGYYPASGSRTFSVGQYVWYFYPAASSSDSASGQIGEQLDASPSR